MADDPWMTELRAAMGAPASPPPAAAGGDDKWMAEMQAAMQRGAAPAQDPAAASAAPATSPAPAAEKTGLGSFGQAARVIANDLNAGFQGINPIKTERLGQRVGIVRRDMGVVDVDGEFIGIERFKGDKWVTLMDKDGREVVYYRDPKIEDSAVASFGRLVGYGIVGGAGPVLKNGVVAAIRGKPGAATQAARDALATGVTPSLGMRGGIGARVAAVGEGFIPTTGPVVRDAERAVGELATAAAKVAGTAGKASSPAAAGASIIAGANHFARRSGEIGGRLFDAVGRMIPKGSPVQMGKTETVLQELSATFAGKPNIGKQAGAGNYAGFLDDVRGGMTWEQASKWRSALLEANRKIVGPFANIPDGEKKRIAQALTADMEAAAKAAGPKAEAAWTRARNFWRGRGERIEKALKPIFKADAAARPEVAFREVFALTGDGARASLTRLNGIKKTMRHDEWGEVVSTVITRMGRATPGAQNAASDAFSPATFMTNWNRMTPEAKLVLFEGNGIPAGLRGNLDRLARVMERGKEAGRQINSSRSGVTASNFAGLGAVQVDPVTAIASGVGLNVSARVFLSRPVLNAVTRFYAAKSAQEQTMQAALILRLVKQQQEEDDQAAQPTKGGMTSAR